ncbi:hypothetical protein YC2023_081519 [Brassica napus]
MLYAEVAQVGESITQLYSAALNRVFTTGHAMGYLVGEIVVDKMSQIFQNSGRVMSTQFIFFMGAILSIILKVNSTVY